MKTDEQLAEAALRGDRHSLGRLVERYQKQVIVLAYRLVGNWEDAKDVAQESFVKLITRLGSYRGESSFRTWFYRIVVNKSIDHRRKRMSRPHPVSVLSPEDLAAVSGGSDGVFEDSHILNLESLLEKLSPNQRIALVLRHYEGLSLREVAGVLGCAETTARGHIFRALKKIRESFP